MVLKTERLSCLHFFGGREHPSKCSAVSYAEAYLYKFGPLCDPYFTSVLRVLFGAKSVETSSVFSGSLAFRGRRFGWLDVKAQLSGAFC